MTYIATATALGVWPRRSQHDTPEDAWSWLYDLASEYDEFGVRSAAVRGEMPESGESAWASDADGVTLTVAGGFFCECNSCQYAQGFQSRCDSCEGWFTGADADCDNCSASRCEDCEELHENCTCDSDSDSPYVHNYSYKPEPNFLRAGKDKASEKLFLGLELEVATDEPGELAQLIYSEHGQQEQMLYGKEDGSIQGLEIVSHPMTHAYFREHFPFAMLAKDSRATKLLRYRRPNASYGLHVHISRDSFKDEAHALRWLLLIYKNQDEVSKLARRESADWAAFSDADYNEDKARGGGGRARYVAVNAMNHATFEVRVFRSTWQEQELRAAVDFVHATALYTRGMTSAVALADGMEWQRFSRWTARKSQYSNLSAELTRIAAIEPEAASVQDVPVIASEPDIAQDAVWFDEECSCAMCARYRIDRANLLASPF